MLEIVFCTAAKCLRFTFATSFLIFLGRLTCNNVRDVQQIIDVAYPLRETTLLRLKCYA